MTSGVLSTSSFLLKTLRIEQTVAEGGHTPTVLLHFRHKGIRFIFEVEICLKVSEGVCLAVSRTRLQIAIHLALLLLQMRLNLLERDSESGHHVNESAHILRHVDHMHSLAETFLLDR